MEETELTALQRRLGYTFRDPGLLLQALTHRSYAHEQGEFGALHNERLEFVGDAVLALCVASQLMEELPQAREGQLTRLRASLVSEPSLARCGRELGLWVCLLLGRVVRRSGGED